jgi:hypothetical protein
MNGKSEAQPEIDELPLIISWPKEVAMAQESRVAAIAAEKKPNAIFFGLFFDLINHHFTILNDYDT